MQEKLYDDMTVTKLIKYRSFIVLDTYDTVHDKLLKLKLLKLHYNL